MMRVYQELRRIASRRQRQRHRLCELRNRAMYTHAQLSLSHCIRQHLNNCLLLHRTSPRRRHPYKSYRDREQRTTQTQNHVGNMVSVHGSFVHKVADVSKDQESCTLTWEYPGGASRYEDGGPPPPPPREPSRGALPPPPPP